MVKRLPRSDKRFLILALLLTALLLCGGLWWGALNAIPQITIPHSSLPSRNAFEFYVKAFQNHVERPQTLYEGYDPKTKKTIILHQSFEQSLSFYRKPELQAWLAQNQTALQLLRQGFQYEYHQPPERFSTSHVNLWSYFGTARGMTRTLVAESHIRAAKNDWPGAANSALDALRMGHDMARGSTFIGAQCGYSHQGMARSPLKFILPYLDAKTCRMAALRIEKLHQNRVPFPVVLTEQKWAMQAALLAAMRQNDWQKQAASLKLLGNGSPPKWRPRSKTRLMNDYTALMDSLIALTKRPYTQSTRPKTPADPLLAPVTESYFWLHWNDAQSATGDTLLMLALALRAYQLEHGTFPEKLDVLVPGYLQSIPADPFGSGEALRYKKEPANYKLWSIGPDGKDDGGLFAVYPGYDRSQEAEAKKHNVTRFYFVQPDSKGDFVFGVNH